MSEHTEQVAIFQWAALHRKKYPALDLLYAVPNAAKRTPRLGAWMKAEGLKTGVPDIVLPVARGGFHSLYIELKIGRNKPTPNQLLFMRNLTEHGNLCQVCYGEIAATNAIQSYLETGRENKELD